MGLHNKCWEERGLGYSERLLLIVEEKGGSGGSIVGNSGEMPLWGGIVEVKEGRVRDCGK